MNIQYGIKKLDETNWLEPDEASKLYARINPDGSSTSLTGADYLKEVLAPQLRASVPDELKKLFEVAGERWPTAASSIRCLHWAQSSVTGWLIRRYRSSARSYTLRLPLIPTRKGSIGWRSGASFPKRAGKSGMPADICGTVRRTPRLKASIIRRWHWGLLTAVLRT